MDPMMLSSNLHQSFHDESFSVYEGSIPRLTFINLGVTSGDINIFYIASCRLQTGMRGAFGKPQGTVARVRIGQPLISVRARDQNKAEVIESLRRAKFKFPGRQKVTFSKFKIKYSWIIEQLLGFGDSVCESRGHWLLKLVAQFGHLFKCHVGRFLEEKKATLHA